MSLQDMHRLSPEGLTQVESVAVVARHMLNLIGHRPIHALEEVPSLGAILLALLRHHGRRLAHARILQPARSHTGRRP